MAKKDKPKKAEATASEKLLNFLQANKISLIIDKIHKPEDVGNLRGAIYVVNEYIRVRAIYKKDLKVEEKTNGEEKKVEIAN